MTFQKVIYSGHIMTQEQELIQKHLLFDAVAAIQLYVYMYMTVCLCVCVRKRTERETFCIAEDRSKCHFLIQ